MKKTINLIISLLILASFVIADVGVGIDIETEENLYAEIDLEAGGDMDVRINGVDYEKELNDVKFAIPKSRTSIYSIYWQMSNIFMTKNTKAKTWTITSKYDLEPSAYYLRLAMENYMLTVVANRYEQRIRNLELDIMMLKSLHSDTDLLEAKKQVVTELEIKKFEHKGITYINYDGTFVVMENIPEEPEPEFKIEDIKVIPEEIYPDAQSYIDLICPNGNWTNGKCIRR